MSANNIRVGTSIFGIGGTVTPSPTNCSSDAEINCVTSPTYLAVDVGAFVGSDLRVGKTLAGIVGSLADCATDGAGACRVDGVSYKAARLSNFVASDIKSGVVVAGVSGLSSLEAHTNCAADGDTGCVTTPSYPAVNSAVAVAGNIKSSVIIGGVTGQYPSATYPLNGADVTADLSSGTFNGQIKSATPFEYWNSAGNRQTGTGSANIVAANIVNGTSIFGTAGSATVESHIACASDGASGCAVDGALYKAARLANFVAADIKSGITVASVAGSSSLESHSPCGADAATGCVATASYPAVNLGVATPGNIKSGVTIGGSAGQFPSATYPLNGAGVTADLTNATFNSQIKNAAGFEYWDSTGARHTGAGDTNISAPNLVNAISVFGTTGSAIVEAHGSCASDGASNCVPDGVGYKAARLANFTAADVRSGITIAGVAGSATMESHANCALDGAQNCVTTASYPAANAVAVVPGSIKAGVTIAGVAGQYPSATYTLTGAGGTADLTSATFNTQIKSATAFEFWDSTGVRHTGNGNANVTSANIVSGKSIFGTAGSGVVESHGTCASDGASGCITDTSYKAARLANFAAADVRSGVTIAGVNGTLNIESHSNCASDGAGNCVVDGTNYKAADASLAVAGNIKSGATIAGVSGQYPSATFPLAGNTGTADLDLSTFNTKIKGIGAFEWFDSAGTRYSRSGDSNILGNFIVSGVSIFGTVGTYAADTLNASNLTANKVVVGSLAVTWNRMGSGVILVRRVGSPVTWLPAHGTGYALGDVDANHKIIYIGAATSVNDTAVTDMTTYHYRVFAYDTYYAFSAGSNPASALYSTAEVCGAVGDDCYSDTTAKTNGVAVTPSGKAISYVTSSGANKVWKETSGSRVLRANGLDEWAKQLNIDGKGQSSVDFTSYTSITGRVCPPNVYIDDNNKFTTNNCLYYTTEASAQALNAAGTSQTVLASMGLGQWSSYNGGASRWYVGNIKTCSSNGMRLPTIYETSVTPSYVDTPPTGNGTPTAYAQTNGVPSNGSSFTWTASAGDGTATYWAWDNTNYAWDDYGYPNSYKIRCVLP